jgi:hypothetical protein
VEATGRNAAAASGAREPSSSRVCGILWEIRQGEHQEEKEAVGFEKQAMQSKAEFSGIDLEDFASSGDSCMVALGFKETGEQSDPPRRKR